MFTNPGKKLKFFGLIIFIVAACSVLVAAITTLVSIIAVASQSYRPNVVGIIFEILGWLISTTASLFFCYIASLFLIAFGELVQNTTDINGVLQNKFGPPPAPVAAPKPVAAQAQYPAAPAVQVAPVQNPAAPKGSFCPQCGTSNPPGATFCGVCGHKF